MILAWPLVASLFLTFGFHSHCRVRFSCAENLSLFVTHPFSDRILSDERFRKSYIVTSWFSLATANWFSSKGSNLISKTPSFTNVYRERNQQGGIENCYKLVNSRRLKLSQAKLDAFASERRDVFDYGWPTMQHTCARNKHERANCAF